MNKILLIIFIGCFSSLEGYLYQDNTTEASFEQLEYDSVEYTDEVLAKDFSIPSHISPEVWEQVKPYLLPDNHPAKKKLDKIFRKTRAVLDHESFKNAGFSFEERKRIESPVVGIHKKCPKYVVKAFLDCQIKVDEWSNWINRIKGAEIVREYINSHGYVDFEVPRKWIYLLPEFPSPPEDPKYIRRNFVLVADNMRIYSLEETKKFYKEIEVERLDQLFDIIQSNGLSDSAFLRNIPYTKRGTIAFIDTEHYHVWPICYERVNPCLSREMRQHWRELVNTVIHLKSEHK